MPRTFAGFVLPLAMSLSLLALPLPGKSVAGPPEEVSGKMVLDKVEDGLRRYRKETDPENRIKWLTKLAPTQNPRVAVVLMEANDEGGSLKSAAVRLLGCHFVRGTRFEHTSFYDVGTWWKENEAGLRRRAKQLPRWPRNA